MTKHAAVFLLLFPLLAGAAELKGGYPACISAKAASERFEKRAVLIFDRHVKNKAEIKKQFDD